MATIRIDQIKTGDRTRKDMGDIAALAASVKAIGLVNPITLNPEHGLVCGARRIEAAKSLGWTEIAYTVAESAADVVNALKMEAGENTCRESFKPTEAAKMARLIEEAERPKAAARMAAGKSEKPSEKISEGVTVPKRDEGETKTIAARAVGMSRPTLEKAQAVVEAAEAEPEKYADIAKRMDNTGKVDPAHKELLRRQNEAEKSEPESKPVEPKEASRHEPRGVGLDWAHKAIAMLQQIPSKDGLRKEALELVVRWCKHNAKEST